MFCFACDRVAACGIREGKSGLCGVSAHGMALRERLLSGLIGLARATEGNEYLLTDATAEAAAEGLAALFAGSEEALSGLIARADAEKRKLVPSCYICASPCGRTDNYCVDNLRFAPEAVRTLKARILSGARAIASKMLRGECGADRVHSLLYMALFALGRDDWGEEELQSIAREVEKAGQLAN